MNGKVGVFVATVGIFSSRSAYAFTQPYSTRTQQSQLSSVAQHSLANQSTLSAGALYASKKNQDVVLYSDEWEDGVPRRVKKKNRWNSLSPTVKAKIVKEAQARAIRNKKKNESANDKKRRKLFFGLLPTSIGSCHFVVQVICLDFAPVFFR